MPGLQVLTFNNNAAFLKYYIMLAWN